jgi:hypothetical protein
MMGVHMKGRWEGRGAAVKAISDALTKWEEERPKRARGYTLFYCPTCTKLAELSYSTYRRRGAPKCPRCGAEMARYDEGEFSRRRREAAEEARRLLPEVLKALAEAAEKYDELGRPPEEWKFEDGVITVKPDILDPSAFEYDPARRLVHVVMFRFDQPKHREILHAVARESTRLGLSILAEIYPPHADKRLLPQGAKLGENGMYVVKA